MRYGYGTIGITVMEVLCTTFVVPCPAKTFKIMIDVQKNRHPGWSSFSAFMIGQLPSEACKHLAARQFLVAAWGQAALLVVGNVMYQAGWAAIMGQH